MKYGFHETFEEYKEADNKEHHVEDEEDNEQSLLKCILDGHQEEVR